MMGLQEQRQASPCSLVGSSAELVHTLWVRTSFLSTLAGTGRPGHVGTLALYGAHSTKKITSVQPDEVHEMVKVRVRASGAASGLKG